MYRYNENKNQRGFSLVELMVGLVIGLLTTLVIMQTFSAFEGQKRTTSGTADAQTNGSIALSIIQSKVQQAGYGLPLPNVSKVLRCNPFPNFVDPISGASTNIFPIEIVDSADPNGNSDRITVRYSTNAMGAVPVPIINANNPTTTGIQVENHMGCNIDKNTNNDDIALVMNKSVCDIVTVNQVFGTGDTQNVQLAITPQNNPTALSNDSTFACMGNWQDFEFKVDGNNQLTLVNDPLVSEVVSLQAQYGISDIATQNNVTAWVDATGDFQTPTLDNRNRIKAIKVAVVLRNGLSEKTPVSQACNGTAPGLAKVCIWNDTAAPQSVNLTATTDWNLYRYRVFETIIPLRNILWTRGPQGAL